MESTAGRTLDILLYVLFLEVVELYKQPLCITSSLFFITSRANVKISKFNCLCISVHETHIWNLEKNKGAFTEKDYSLLDFNLKVKIDNFDCWNMLNNT